MIIVGICGRSGSGKTTVLKHIGKKYPSIIDCDEISREVVKKDEPCLRELVSFFGEEILFSDGSLNRGLLASLSFSDKNKTKKLNEITHKYIIDNLKQKLDYFSSIGAEYVFIDAPVLFESGLDKICDVILAVISNSSHAIERIRNRDNKTDEEINKRLSAQMEEKEIVEKSDYVIENNGTIEELYEKVDVFLVDIEEKYVKKY